MSYIEERAEAWTQGDDSLIKKGTQALESIVTPVVKGAEQILTAAVNNPVKTIAQIAAVTIPGMQWALPVIEGIDVVAKGGNIEDVLKAVAVSYVAGEAGKTAGSVVGSATGSNAAAAIASGAARAGTSAIIRGQDVGQALLLGGISGGVPVALKNVPGFDNLGDIEKDIISSIAVATVTGKDVGQAAATALVSGIVTASGVVTKTLNAFDSKGNMTPEQRALATDLLMNTSVAALSGGNASQAMQKTLIDAGTKSLNTMINDKLFKSDAKALADQQAKVSETAKAIEAKQKRQEQVVLNYNTVVRSLNGSVASLDRYKKQLDESLASYDAGKMDFVNVNRALEFYNRQVNSFNTHYEQELKPTIDRWGGELAKIQAETGDLEKVYKAAVEKYATSANTFATGLAPVIKSINEAYATTMDPKFSALDYAKSAGLDASKDDVYAHWLGKGQFEGIPTNKAAANLAITNEKVRLIDELAKAKGISLAQITDTDAKNLFVEIDKKYGGDFVAIQKATIQDLVSGNAKSLNDLLKTSEANGYRVDVSGTAKGAWDKPVGYTPPEGMRLATVGEKDNGTGILSYTDKGDPVWIAKSTSPITVWDPKQGDYVPVSWDKDGAGSSLPTTVVTAPKLKEDDYVAWTLNAARTPNGLDQDLWNFGSTIAGLKAVAATASSGLGEQLQTFGSAYGLATGGSMNNVAVQIGSAMEEWGKANTTENIKKQMAAVNKGLEDAQKVEGFWGQSKAVLSVVKNNPMAYLAYIGQELTQEVVPMGAGFITAAITSAFASPIAGVSAGTMMATMIEGIEVFGSTGKQVYDTLIKEGYSEEYARNRAILAGTTGAVTSAPTNALANAAIMVPFLRGMGAAGATATKVGVAGAGVVANQVAEYAETYTQTLITQLATNRRLNFIEANVSATFAAVISGGTTGVTMAPTVFQGAVSLGRDVAGNNLTWEGVTTGRQIPATINGNAVVGTNSTGRSVTLAEVAYNGANSEAGSVLRSSVYTPQLDNFLAPFTFTRDRVKAAAAAEGITLTNAEADKWVSFNSGGREAEVRAAIKQEESARKAAAEVSARKAAEEAARKAAEESARKAAAEEAARKAAEESARKAAAEAAARKAAEESARKAAEESARKAAADAAAQEAARKAAEEAARKAAEAKTQAAEAEAARLQAAQEAARKAAEESARKAAEDAAAQEVARKAAEEAAKEYRTMQDVLTKITDTEAALTKAIGDAAKAGLEGDAALQAGIEKVAGDLGTTKEDILKQLGTTETQLKKDFELQIGGVQTQLSDVEAALTKAIDDARKSGLEGDAALQAGLDKVADDLGITRNDLITQLTETQTALTKAIDDAKKAGLEGDAALKAGIEKVAGDLGVTKNELLTQLGTTEAELKTLFTKQLGGLETKLSGVETALTKAIDDAKRAGLEGDAALKAGIDKVAGDLGLTKNELLTQLGTTEAQLKQNLATQIGGVQTQIADVDAAIRAEIAKNEAAGMARDAALDKAVTDVAAQLGTTKQDLIARITQSETALGQQITGVSQDLQTKYDSLTDTQKELADQLTQQGMDLQSAIDLVGGQVTGVSKDLQTKYDSLSKGQQDVVTQLTQQGVDLNKAIDTVAGQVSQTQDILGRPGETATQSDVDAIIKLLETQGAYDPRYDFDGNKVIDQNDRVAIEQYIRMRQPDYIPDETIPTSFNPATGSKWAPTGLFASQAAEADRVIAAQGAEAERTRQAQAAEAERIRQAQATQARNAQRLQLATAKRGERMGNLNTMMGMMSQAPDLYGQQVSVATPDPVNIRGAYDWSSIFGSPAQEKMFVTPYAKGGAVRNDMDDVNDELLKLLGG